MCSRCAKSINSNAIYSTIIFHQLNILLIKQKCELMYIMESLARPQTPLFRLSATYTFCCHLLSHGYILGQKHVSDVKRLSLFWSVCSKSNTWPTQKECLTEPHKSSYFWLYILSHLYTTQKKPTFVEWKTRCVLVCVFSVRWLILIFIIFIQFIIIKRWLPC